MLLVVVVVVSRNEITNDSVHGFGITMQVEPAAKSIG